MCRLNSLSTSTKSRIIALPPSGTCATSVCQVPMRQLALAYYQTYGLTENFTGRAALQCSRTTVSPFTPSSRASLMLSLFYIATTSLRIPIRPRSSNSRKRQQRLPRRISWQHTGTKPDSEPIFSPDSLVIVPKVGPLTLVAVKGPTQQTEEDYVHSVAVSTTALRRILLRFTPEMARYKGPASRLEALSAQAMLYHRPSIPFIP